MDIDVTCRMYIDTLDSGDTRKRIDVEAGRLGNGHFVIGINSVCVCGNYVQRAVARKGNVTDNYKRHFTLGLDVVITLEFNGYIARIRINKQGCFGRLGRAEILKRQHILGIIVMVMGKHKRAHIVINLVVHLVINYKAHHTSRLAYGCCA